MDTTTKKVWDIEAIEAMTEAEASAMAEEKLEIKGHNVYLLTFPGYFGYSAVVFCNGHHIRYADDYELHYHHSSSSDGYGDAMHDELRGRYIDGRNNILFTEDELRSPIKDYDEYKRKEYFLRNYYGMRVDYLSIFGNGNDPKAVADFEKAKEEYRYYSFISFAYFKDKSFVDHQEELYNALQAAMDAMKGSEDYWIDAFKREMANHEYHINWQADYDTLSAFGGIKWHGEGATLDQYFDDLGFNEVQRRAYLKARERYYKDMEEWEKKCAVNRRTFFYRTVSKSWNYPVITVGGNDYENFF